MEQGTNLISFGCDIRKHCFKVVLKNLECYFSKTLIFRSAEISVETIPLNKNLFSKKLQQSLNNSTWFLFQVQYDKITLKIK